MTNNNQNERCARLVDESSRRGPSTFERRLKRGKEGGRRKERERGERERERERYEDPNTTTRSCVAPRFS